MFIKLNFPSKPNVMMVSILFLFQIVFYMRSNFSKNSSTWQLLYLVFEVFSFSYHLKFSFGTMCACRCVGVMHVYVRVDSIDRRTSDLTAIWLDKDWLSACRRTSSFNLIQHSSLHFPYLENILILFNTFTIFSKFLYFTI